MNPCKEKQLISAKSDIPILIFLVMVMLYSGLRPFDYIVPNGVQWIRHSSGVRFNGGGIILGGTVGTIDGRIPSGNTDVTLEAVFKPSVKPLSHVTPILSITDAGRRERIFLGQWKDTVVLRWIDGDGFTAATKTRIGSDGILDLARTTVCTFVFSGSRTSLFIDGVLQRHVDGATLIRMMGDSSISHIVLGNNPSGTNGWQGELNGFSLINRALNHDEIRQRFIRWKVGSDPDLLTDGTTLLYRFREGKGNIVINEASALGWDLTIPPVLKPLRKGILALPTVETLKMRHFYTDAAVNLAGFVPFGFILSLFLSRRWRSGRWILFLSSIFLSAVLSLTIELNQVFLLSRDSSITDLVLNICGGAAGTITFWFVEGRGEFLTPADKKKRRIILSDPPPRSGGCR